MTDRLLTSSTSPFVPNGSLWSGTGQTLPDWFSDLDVVMDTNYRPTAKRFGAKGNAIKLLDGAITAGSPTFTSASATFSAKDIGKTISVVGAGLAMGYTSYQAAAGFTNNALTSTIVSVTNANTVVLQNNATATVTNAMFVYGTDDTAAIQATLDALGQRGGGAADLSRRNYLVRDILELSWDYIGLQNGTIIQVDTPSVVNGGTTIANGSSSNYNWVTTGGIWMNARQGGSYTGPSFPNGRPYSRNYYTMIDSDWAYGQFVTDVTLDSSLVSYGFGGCANGAGYPTGAQGVRGGSPIGGILLGSPRVLRCRLINPQTSGISLRLHFDAVADGNTIEGFRCFPAGNGDVWGGNGIEMMSAYNGAPLAISKERGSGRITNNTLVGSMSPTFPDKFINSGQNSVYTGNIAIDVQTGDRPYGAAAPWVSGKQYNVNDRINVNGTPFICTVGGVSGSSGPSSSSISLAITDGGVTWAYAAPGASWAPGTAYAVGRRVSFVGNTYQCITGGVSHNGTIVPWVTGTGYTAGMLVSNGGNVYRCLLAVTSNTAPVGQNASLTDNGQANTWTWVATLAQYPQAIGPTGTGASVPDGSCVWALAFQSPSWAPNQTYTTGTKILWGDKTYTCVIPGISAPLMNNWTISTGYSVGQVIAANNQVYVCTASTGNSAASGTGPSTVVNNITDGGVTWNWLHPLKEGPGGNGNYVQDGSVVWQSVTSYQRQVAQHIVMGNNIRKWECGIMAEGQRQGGAGDCIIVNNDVANCIGCGIQFYSDMQDFSTTASNNNGVSGFNNAYSVLILGNRVSNCWICGIQVNGAHFGVIGNIITDWGSTSLAALRLGYLANYTNIASAIKVTPSTPGLAWAITKGGIISGNDCRIINAIDPIANPWYINGISVATMSSAQVCRGVTIADNIIDLTNSLRVNAAPWLSGATYVAGQYVSQSSGIYQCVTGGVAATAPSGTSVTALTAADANGVVWQYLMPSPGYNGNMSAISLQGMFEDTQIHNNTIIRCPVYAIFAGTLKTTASWVLGPARLSIRENKIVDGNYANVSGASAIIINTQRAGITVEQNELNDTQGVARYARFLSMPEEVVGTNNVADDIIIRLNKWRNLGVVDINAIQLFTSGANVKIENNDGYNYIMALPSFGVASTIYLYAGVLYWNKTPTPGNPAAWIGQTSGRITLVNWTTGVVYSANTYVNSNGNVYKCTIAGTAGATAPSGTGSAVSDGGATWSYYSPQPTFAAFDILPASKMGIAAAGTTQAAGTPLVVGLNVISTVAAATAGVTLPQGILGAAGLPTPGVLGTVTNITVFNTSTTNSVQVYPATGGQINALGVNAPYTLAAGASVTFRAVSTTINTTNTTQYYV